MATVMTLTQVSGTDSAVVLFELESIYWIHEYRIPNSESQKDLIERSLV